MIINNAVAVEKGLQRDLMAHSERVAELSYRLGKKINLDKERLNKLHAASLLHDIGKSRIPDSILNKPSSLTKAEFQQIKLHVHYSYDILKFIGCENDICLIAKHHHENYDGSGYPDGLKGEEIPLESRIIRITDTYDALTTDRVYQKKVDKNKALAIMKKESHAFDFYLLRHFISLMEDK